VPSGRLRQPSVIKVTDSQSEQAALAGIPLAIYGFSRSKCGSLGRHRFLGRASRRSMRGPG
jgi:hypothetical protein